MLDVARHENEAEGRGPKEVSCAQDAYCVLEVPGILGVMSR